MSTHDDADDADTDYNDNRRRTLHGYIGCLAFVSNGPKLSSECELL